MYILVVSFATVQFFSVCVTCSVVTLNFETELEVKYENELSHPVDTLEASNNFTSNVTDESLDRDFEESEAQNENDLDESRNDGLCACGTRNGRSVRSSRIVGGVVTRSGEIPWRATLFVYNKRTPNRGSMCSGTIISRNWILTAAHCVRSIRSGIDNLDVYVGAQANPVSVGSGQKYLVARYFEHPSFNSENYDSDIALVRLQKPLTFGPKVAPACLPFGSLAESNFQGARVLASGWGTTKAVQPNRGNRNSVSNTLRKVELQVLTTPECSKLQRVTQNQFCTLEKGKDTCQGDSGGSIDYMHSNGRYYAIGVVSHGIGCALRKHPGVYTKVNNYLRWISFTTGETYCGS